MRYTCDVTCDICDLHGNEKGSRLSVGSWSNMEKVSGVCSNQDTLRQMAAEKEQTRQPRRRSPDLRVGKDAGLLPQLCTTTHAEDAQTIQRSVGLSNS
jgi:hypothetical protein